MLNFRDFSFLADSFLKFTKEKKDRTKWTLSVFNPRDPGYDFDLIKLKYYKILSNHYNSPTFDNSPESLWNYLSERKLRDSKDYTDDLEILKKIKSVPNCFEQLKSCEELKIKYQKIIFSEMKEFALEMVDRGMDPLDVLFLCSMDTSWARLYHIFYHHYVHMYSPRAHFISLTVQRVELYNLYLEKLRIELLEALYCKYNPARELFTKTIIQKRKLISQDSYFYKKLKEELPQLPISKRIQSMDIEDVVDRIKRVTPTVEATKIEKEFLEEIHIAMDENIQKQMDERVKEQEELKKLKEELRERDKEYWEKIEREEDLMWDKLLQEEIQKITDKPLVLEEEGKEELDQPEEELDQPEEELDQPGKELDQPDKELDQPDKELDLDQPDKEQKKKPAKPLKQKKKNSKKDKNS